jgi:hypothetical protein
MATLQAIKLALAVILPLTLPLHGFASASGCPPYIWLAFGEQSRLPDGSVRQHYHIRKSGTSLPESTMSHGLQAFYRLGSRTTQGQDFFPAPVVCREGDCSLDITSSTTARLEVYVVGTCENRHFMAQTVQALFGKAGASPTSAPALLSNPIVDLPHLSLAPSYSDYYMQTGQTYNFSYAGHGSAAETVSVFERQQRLAAAVTLEPTGDFAFTPSRDPGLDSTGPQASKETVLLIQETANNRGYATTFTLLLHRSRSAQLQLLPGGILFGLTAAAILALVIVMKKRPWYR